MTIQERTARADAADALCAEAYRTTAEKTGAPSTGVAMIAVGGYGRRELAPCSDLDVILVHDDGVDVGELAQLLWYPLWDSGADVDHAVRSESEMVSAAGADLRVALGLLDMRHLAGDPGLTLRLRTAVLARWRREARERLPVLHRLVRERHELMGELAHQSVPDLKECDGGLRDATVLKALVATWLVDVPHVELERARGELLDVRDALHAATGRGTDRIAPETWPALAERLGEPDVVAAQVRVRELGRRLTHLSRLTWRRVDAVLTRPASLRDLRKPALESLGCGVALARGEVVLDARARPSADPLLLLRAAAEAAERDVVLAPTTAARLARESAPLPDPWPPAARQLLVRLLASGPGLLGTWETLEATGGLERVLPEWSRIRSLPHASAIHRFTVDRHVVETCIEAARLIRDVARPDVLVVAALLHDIGKGGLTEHSVAGEPIARTVATRMGFAPDEVDLIGTLVRWHLLLGETATTRDPDDPATIETVTDRITTPETLSLLLALSEADARAASAKAWSTWRAGLVRQLAARARAALQARADGTPVPRAGESEVPVPAEVVRDPRATSVEVTTTGDGSTITIVTGDRVGLLADASAALALLRVPVRAARAWAQGAYGVSVWETAETHVDAGTVRARLEAVVDGRIDAHARLSRPAPARLAPSVAVRPEASRSATVLEVRMEDKPGVVHLVCAALAELGISVRSAHVSTLGPQAVDVFYLQEDAAGALADERAAAAAHAVRAALVATVTP